MTSRMLGRIAMQTARCWGLLKKAAGELSRAKLCAAAFTEILSMAGFPDAQAPRPPAGEVSYLPKFFGPPPLVGYL